MRAAKVQASLRFRAVSPEPPLLAHTSSESRGTFRQKARSLAPLNGWACAAKICHDGMLVDTNSLDAAQFLSIHVIGFFSGYMCSQIAFIITSHEQTQTNWVRYVHIFCNFLASKRSLFQNLLYYNAFIFFISSLVQQVLCQGQIIGAVVAETQVQAQRAAKCVKVEYEELEPIITIQVYNFSVLFSWTS